MSAKEPEKRSFGQWLSVKQNFLIYSVVGAGVLPGIVLAWWLASEHEGLPALYLLLIVALACGGGYVWGLIMWRFFGFKRQQWQRLADDHRDDV